MGKLITKLLFRWTLMKWARSIPASDEETSMWRPIATVTFMKEWGIVWSKLGGAGVRFEGGYGAKQNPWPGDVLTISSAPESRAEVLEALQKQVEAGRLADMKLTQAEAVRLGAEKTAADRETN